MDDISEKITQCNLHSHGQFLHPSHIYSFSVKQRTEFVGIFDSEFPRILHGNLQDQYISKLCYKNLNSITFPNTHICMHTCVAMNTYMTMNK